MNGEINNFLLLLESTLINVERPDYVEISYQNGFIFLLVSRRDYKYYSISERIKSLFTLLEFYHSDIIEEYPVIIEALDDSELTELFKLYAK